MNFPYHRLYPLDATLEQFFIPSSHPWYPQAKEAVQELSIPGKAWTFQVLSSSGTHVLTKRHFPFVIKFGYEDQTAPPFVSRVLFADRLRQFAKEEKLSEVVIPDKFLFRIRPGKISCKTCIVISKKINYNKLVSPNHKAVAQTAYLIAKTGFVDAHSSNVVPLKDGRLAVIDTDEPFSKTLLYLLLQRRWDHLGLNRDTEISQYSSLGIYKFLLDPCRRVCLVRKKALRKLHRKMVHMMEHEMRMNRLYRLAQKILVHGRIFSPPSRDLQARRYQNLLKRCDRLGRRHSSRTHHF